MIHEPENRTPVSGPRSVAPPRDQFEELFQRPVGSVSRQGRGARGARTAAHAVCGAFGASASTSQFGDGGVDRLNEDDRLIRPCHGGDNV